MRKIFPGGEYALQIRPADQKIGEKLFAVKLTREQAIAFPFGMTCEQMMNKYPHLEEGEQYDGYIAISYGGKDLFIDVCYLRGALVKVKTTESWKYIHTLQDAVRDGIYYDVIYTTPRGEKIAGAFQYFWAFNGCKFAKECQEMQKAGMLDGAINADELDKSLKDKVVKSIIDNAPAELTEDEYRVLRRYLGFSKRDWGELIETKHEFFRWYKDNG